jgi:hypothetical protein
MAGFRRTTDIHLGVPFVSDLQLALLALAALLLVALYVNGKWQEHRLLRRMRDRLQGGVGDALLHGEAVPVPKAPLRGLRASAVSPPRSPAQSRPEPAAPAQVAEPADPAGPAAGRQEPSITSEVLPTPAALLQPGWVEDPMLDCTLELRCTRALDGVSVIDAASALAHGGLTLPVHFVVWDGRHQQWVLPDRFGYYADALASLQLAHRHGRADQAQVARFVEIVRHVAGALDADVDPPDMERVLAQTQELDRLCARFDIKIDFTVASTQGGWTGPQLRGAAQQAGLVPVDARRWSREDSRGEVLFTMNVPAAPIESVILELDVSLAPIAALPVRAMAECARTLAGALGGRVVDDNGAPIDERAVEVIESQLAPVYAEMRAAGLEPGGERARRLYA